MTSRKKVDKETLKRLRKETAVIAGFCSLHGIFLRVSSPLPHEIPLDHKSSVMEPFVAPPLFVHLLDKDTLDEITIRWGQMVATATGKAYRMPDGSGTVYHPQSVGALRQLIRESDVDRFDTSKPDWRHSYGRSADPQAEEAKQAETGVDGKCSYEVLRKLLGVAMWLAVRNLSFHIASWETPVGTSYTTTWREPSTAIVYLGGRGEGLTVYWEELTENLIETTKGTASPVAAGLAGINEYLHSLVLRVAAVDSKSSGDQDRG